MNILVAHPGPAFSVHDVYVGWCEGLTAAGAKVARFNLHDRLSFYGSVLLPVPDQPDTFKRALDGNAATDLALDGLCSDLWILQPDVLVVVSGFLIPAELLDAARARGVRVVVLHTESPYEDERQIAYATHADLNVINDPTNLDRFEAVAPTVYLPHAYRPAIHCPGPSRAELVCDLGFVGTGFPSRVEWFERLAPHVDGLDVLLAGNWQSLPEASPILRWLATEQAECLDNVDTVDLYRSARVGINIYRREGDDGHAGGGWAMGPREVEMAATGAFFLRDPRPESDAVLPMLPTFTGPEHAAELLRWWLDHPDDRAEAAHKARAAVEHQTFTNHAAQLLRLLDA